MDDKRVTNLIQKDLKKESKAKRKNVGIAWLTTKWQCYSSAKLDCIAFEYVEDIGQSHKIYNRSLEKPDSGIESRNKNFCWSENPGSNLLERCSSNIINCNRNDANQSHTLEMHWRLQID